MIRNYFLLCSLCIVLGCSNDEASPGLTIRPADGIYGDYQLWAEEDEGDVTVRLQFRKQHDEGEPVAVGENGKVLLDGEEMPADSTRFAGVYYEVTRPLETFRGQHTIVYIDENAKEHKEEFLFEPFALSRELPENIKKRPFKVHLQNFPERATLIRLVMVDTSHLSADVNEEVMIKDGVVEITADNLSNLTKGPVTIEIYREEEKRMQDNFYHGKFTMTFGLRRHINLVE